MNSLEHCSRVENYIRYQPGYPKKLVDFLYTDGGFSRESVIADIGSGAGLFSRYLLERGSRLVAIEPDDTMREISERLLSDEFQRFVSIKATAENTTLPDASVDHIVCAQSFHWFDKEKCKKEFARILKPSGTVVIIRNLPVPGNDILSQEIDWLFKRYSVYSEEMRKYTEEDFSLFFGSDCYSVISLPNQHILDFEGLKSLFFSVTPDPLQNEEECSEMVEELSRAFEKYNRSGKITLRYETEAYTGRFSA